MTNNNSKTHRYNTIKTRLALIEPLLLLALFALIQLTGISAHLKRLSINVSSTWYGSVAIYALLFGALFYTATFLLKFYRGYIIEHQFSLSNQTLGGWLKDEVKSIILSLIFFLIFIEFLYALLNYYPEMWWFFMAIGSLFISVALAQLMPIIILPLFYKYEKLDDANLKNRLISLANKFGVKVLDVFKLKISAKTKKANAALVGLGNTRRILLGDTLLENYTEDEVEIVIAHELAHHKLLHIWKTILFSALSTLIIFYLVSLVFAYTIRSSSFNSMKDVAAFPSIMFAISFFSLLSSPAANAFSRRLENSADGLALRVTEMPEAFISCMKKLAKQNMADPSPSRFVEIMLYDHPPISKRIKIAERIINKGEKGKK